MCLSRLENLLLAAHCPDPACDGFGVVEGVAYGSEPDCCGVPLDTGECCGNAVEVQTQEQTQEPCQWCHERSELLDMPELLARPQSEVLGAFDDDLPI